MNFDPLDAELNPVCHLLALLGARHFLHVSRIRVNVNIICNQYGIPYCAHPLNVAVLCFCIWPDDGSNEQKHFAEFLILITNIGCLLTE
jgi:hypothetical protein